MSIIERERNAERAMSKESNLWHLVYETDWPHARTALCGAALKGIDGGWMDEVDMDTCVVCAEMAGL